MKFVRKVLLVILMIATVALFAVPVFAEAQIQDTGQITTAADIPSMVVSMMVIPLLPIISGFLVALIRKKLSEIEQNVNDNKVKKYVNLAEDAVCTAVTVISQTYVDNLKKAKTFDDTAQKAAFIAAKNKAIALMGTEAQKALKALYGDINLWLDNKIEYYVKVSSSNYPIELQASVLQDTGQPPIPQIATA